MKVYEYLADANFLKEIDNQQVKTQYVQITALDWQENELEEIQGQVTGGTINIDSSSTVRRTCNLTFSPNISSSLEFLNIKSLLSINRKISLNIGFKNITQQYTTYDIIWFPFGVFCITDIAFSNSVTGYSISATFKDKMCLLNGDCGGVLTNSINFSQIDLLDNDGNYITSQPTIIQIIRELVNHWGNEQLGKIIINDIDSKIKQVVRWNGAKDADKNALNLFKSEGVNGTPIYRLTKDSVGQEQEQLVAEGTDIGYIYVDFIYSGDLINKPGDTITSILDQIKKCLGGNYEYFYDIDGNFIFQEIKNYLNTSNVSEALSELSYSKEIDLSKYTYSFTDSNLITSYNNAPQYNMIKNDFVVWGQRETAAGTTVDIRYHLAIDEKPDINDYEYSDIGYYKEEGEDFFKIGFFKPYSKDDMGDIDKIYYSEDNQTYYKYINNQWQEVKFDKVELEDGNYQPNDYRTALYISGQLDEPYGTESNYYYEELSTEWPQLCDLSCSNNKKEFPSVVYSSAPIEFRYYLDILDSSELSEYSVSNIGRRSKVYQDTSINCLFEKEIPDYILIRDNDETAISEVIERSQEYLSLSADVYDSLSNGGVLNSAYEVIKDLLYQYLEYNNTVTLQTMPIYYLQPNTLVQIDDSKSQISGDYIISSISIPLDSSGVMTINAKQALKKI